MVNSPEIQTSPPGESLSPLQPKRPLLKRRRFWIVSLFLLFILVLASAAYLIDRAVTLPPSVGTTSPIDYVQSLTFSHDGHMLVAAVNHSDSSGDYVQYSLIAWDVSSGKKLHMFTGEGYVNSVAFSPDGRVVAVGMQNTAMFLWDAISGLALPTRFAHSDSITSVAFNPGGTILATGDGSGAARLWDVNSGRLLKTFISPASPAGDTIVAFSPDGKLLAVGSTNLVLWNVSTGKPSGASPGITGIEDITALAFSPAEGLVAFSAETAASSKAQATFVWDVTGKAKARTLITQDNFVYGLQFSPDGRSLAAAVDPGILERWDMPSGKKLDDIQGTNELVLAFDPAGRVLASGGGDYSSNPNQDSYPIQSAYVELWDASSGNQLRILS
jgi:WD40 repeat protein